MTTRRDLIRATAATAALALPSTVLALPAVSAAGHPDAVLLQAEAEYQRLRSVARGLASDKARAPIVDAAYEQLDIIATTTPATLTGVLVKLRPLADPDLGIDTGTSELDGESLRQCVACLERLA